MRRHLARLVLVAALAAVLAGCAVNPATGRREFTLVSQSQEIAMGREGHAAIVEEFGVHDDAALAARVDSIGQALAARSELPGLEWHFTVLDDPVVNAFALPGGYIYVTRGILAHLNSDAQLAGVLGHEIGHVTARHSARRLSYQQLAGLGIGIASIASESFQRYSQLAQTGLQLMFLKYGRDDENQADELGVKYAASAGYDPREMPATYTMLARTGERSGQRLPTFLSTHPDPGDRETRTRALAQQAAAGRTGLLVEGRRFLLGLEGLPFGEDPRHGYFDGGVFYHPEMRVQMRFPAGWRTQNGRAAVMAAAPEDRGAMQLTLADTKGLAPAAHVQELMRRGSVSRAQGGRETIGGYEAWIGVLAVPQQQGEIRLAAAWIRQNEQRTFQILGRGGTGEEAAVLASARSMAPLTDTRRLAATPDRVKVVPAPAEGSFEDVVKGLGTQAIPLDDTAILNNAWPDEQVFRRQLVKIVTPGAR